MTPTLAIPHAQSAPSVQTSSLPPVSAAPIDTVARITFNAVPPPITAQQGNNNRNTGGIFATGNNNATSSQTTLTSAPPFFNLANGTTLNFFISTPFMAQLFNQLTSSANDNSYANELLNLTPQRPTPSPELLEAFSQVRYLPSNAAKPTPPPPGGVVTTEAANLTIAAHNNSAQRTITFSVEASRAIQEGIAASTGLSQAFSAIASNVTSQGSGSIANDSYSLRKPLRSLVRAEGFDAYIATFSRNMVNLSNQNTTRIDPISL